MRPDLDAQCAEQAVVRPFGSQASDLEPDFSAADRPALVTALLVACTDADARTWWGCSVGARTAGLLRLVAASADRSALHPLLNCPHCGERIEAELPLAELVALDPGTPAFDFGPYRLRRPTGDDLRTLRSAGEAAWLQRWCADSSLSAEQAEAALDTLAQADPLVGFEMACRCPACGEAATIEVDLESLALQRLSAVQRRLLQEVHALASHYGWSEAQIMAVPAARRARYLALIEGTPA